MEYSAGSAGKRIPSDDACPPHDPVVEQIRTRFGRKVLSLQETLMGFPVVWIDKSCVLRVLEFLKTLPQPYAMLYDLHGIDERTREHRDNLPSSEFTVSYHMVSVERNHDFCVKVPLRENDLRVSSAVGLFPNANWYERETWEMFGVVFDGHPNLTHLLLPQGWVGHPLRKDHPSRATELPFFVWTKKKHRAAARALKFHPQTWGMRRTGDHDRFMFLNLGPNHPSVHGVFRIVLQMRGEQIVDCAPDIGFHHRGAEKIGERQTWHNYIPYTDRIEYLGGCVNEMPYVLAVEKMAGIVVPDRAQTIRVLLSELFRINSHLLCVGTYLQDIGAMTPIFLLFTDRQKIHSIVESITGARMHPAWFRIGGVAHDLPVGWEILLKEFVRWLPQRLKMYGRMSLRNSIFRSRSQGIASYSAREALSWGITGAGLRATGIGFDVRRQRPYSGYERFEFDVPVGSGVSDCYTRIMLKVEEIYESLRIVDQCVEHMPEGAHRSDHPLSTPPPRTEMLRDIDALVTHFLQMSWGTVVPTNESFQMIEATKGINSYYLVSDGSTVSYRTRIRTPSFPHLQQIPSVAKGKTLSDLVAYLGSIDFVMSDVDR